MNTLTILQNSGGAGAAIFGLIMMLVYLAVIVAIVYFTIGKAFEKAGHPWWTPLVPIYGTYIWAQIIGKPPVLWTILMFVPFVNIAMIALMHIGMAKSFGKDTTYGILLAFVPIYNLYLWYQLGNNADEKYYGPAGEGVEGFIEFKDMTAAA